MGEEENVSLSDVCVCVPRARCAPYAGINTTAARAPPLFAQTLEKMRRYASLCVDRSYTVVRLDECIWMCNVLLRDGSS